MALLFEFGKVDQGNNISPSMLELKKGQITKEIKKYVVRFTPKYKALNILQNNIEVMVKKSTQL